MPIYKGGSKIKDLYIGGTKIGKLYKGSTLVYQSLLQLPTTKSLPASYTETQVASVSGANNTIYTVTSDGFYRVEVQAGGGHNSGESGAAGGAGGKRSQIVYLYKGTKCLLWSGNQGTTGSYTTYGATGYPSPGDNNLGGTGATGSSEGGGGGGGSASHGRAASHKDGSSGGGGAGFLAGIDKDVTYLTHKESAWSSTIDSRRAWSVGSFSVSNLYCYILCGGGSGACGKNSSARSSGGGGGAFGNGGTTYSTATARTTGPGGTWGQGNAGAHYGTGVAGAWAVLDFSRNQWTWGTGGGSQNADGYCRLYKLV